MLLKSAVDRDTFARRVFGEEILARALPEMFESGRWSQGWVISTTSLTSRDGP